MDSSPHAEEVAAPRKGRGRGKGKGKGKGKVKGEGKDGEAAKAPSRPKAIAKPDGKRNGNSQGKGKGKQQYTPANMPLFEQQQHHMARYDSGLGGMESILAAAAAKSPAHRDSTASYSSSASASASTRTRASASHSTAVSPSGRVIVTSNGVERFSWIPAAGTSAAQATAMSPTGSLHGSTFNGLAAGGGGGEFSGGGGGYDGGGSSVSSPVYPGDSADTGIGTHAGTSSTGKRRLSTVVAPHDAALAAVLSTAKPLSADGSETGPPSEIGSMLSNAQKTKLRQEFPKDACRLRPAEWRPYRVKMKMLPPDEMTYVNKLRRQALSCVYAERARQAKMTTMKQADDLAAKLAKETTIIAQTNHEEVGKLKTRIAHLKKCMIAAKKRGRAQLAQEKLAAKAAKHAQAATAAHGTPRKQTPEDVATAASASEAATLAADRKVAETVAAAAAAGIRKGGRRRVPKLFHDDQDQPAAKRAKKHADSAAAAAAVDASNAAASAAAAEKAASRSRAIARLNKLSQIHNTQQSCIDRLHLQIISIGKGIAPAEAPPTYVPDGYDIEAAIAAIQMV